MIGRFGYIYRHDTLRAVHIAGLAQLDVRVLARLHKRGQKGVFTVKPDQDQQVRPVHHRHEARFHRDPVSIFNTRGQAVNLDQVPPDLARKVRQVGQGRDDLDFGRISRHRPPT